MATPKKNPTFATVPLAGKVGILIAILVLVFTAYFFLLHQPLTDDIATARRANAQKVTERGAALVPATSWAASPNTTSARASRCWRPTTTAARPIMHASASPIQRCCTTPNGAWPCCRAPAPSP